MIKGMTGFGSAQLSTGKIKAVVEIKSLNHRYFDINYFLPIGFGSIEEKVCQLIGKSIKRGRVTISVKIIQKPAQQISMNIDTIKTYLNHAKKINREFRLDNNMTVSDIINLPGVLENKEVLVSPKDLWFSLDKCLKTAINGLVNMRKREGRSLALDITDKLKRMTAQIKTIQARTKAILKDKKKNFTDDEFFSFQKGIDINEEISRLSHYIDELKGYLKSSVPTGKKIDFIAQEMQRETNTIGSKVQDKVVSNAVIALKSKVEKIREQAQNIE